MNHKGKETGDGENAVMKRARAVDDHLHLHARDQRWVDAEGRLHRDEDDLPAFVSADGMVQGWFLHGKPARAGGNPHRVIKTPRGGECALWLDDERRTHRDEDDLPAAITDDGTKLWLVHGRPQRAGRGPHMVLPNGDQAWFDAEARYHRDEEDLPAQVLANGTKFWRIHGAYHRRNGGPHVEFPTGDVGWLDDRGMFHRDGVDGNDDLPAYVFADGTRVWMIHGEYARPSGGPHKVDGSGLQCWLDDAGTVHRDDNDLPAVIGPGPDGIRAWVIHGQYMRRGDKPTCIASDGTQLWLRGGHDGTEERHRLGDKPAVIHPNGDREWWVNGRPWRRLGQPTVVIVGGGGGRGDGDGGHGTGASLPWRPMVVVGRTGAGAGAGIDADDDACPLCLETFGSGDRDRAPVVVCVNGHAMCAKCLQGFMDADGAARACPSCRCSLLPCIVVPPERGYRDS